MFTRVDICIDQHVRREEKSFSGARPRYVELLVVDEADRLNPPPWSTCATASTGHPWGCC